MTRSARGCDVKGPAHDGPSNGVITNFYVTSLLAVLLFGWIVIAVVSEMLERARLSDMGNMIHYVDVVPLNDLLIMVTVFGAVIALLIGLWFTWRWMYGPQWILAFLLLVGLAVTCWEGWALVRHEILYPPLAEDQVFGVAWGDMGLLSRAGVYLLFFMSPILHVAFLTNYLFIFLKARCRQATPKG